ncbi:MAG: hypothetical protein H6704_04570 [Myxococcales bacterium]|nr:hypothetical protein [Myxococcales bacterium]
MAVSAACKAVIVFGGKKENGQTFCNRECWANGALIGPPTPESEAMAAAHAVQIRMGSCPVCGGHGGPVDIHASHVAMSFVFFTRWYSEPRLSCRRCGAKKQLVAFGATLMLGWWGLPWGLLVTPVQLVRNVLGITVNRSPTGPSPALVELARERVARGLVGPG